ncbi:MAG: hypothetical protein JJ894_03295 [Dinoroseobacter sp.]|nr:hypothetical protein [Dinoroseobacter sp.]
MRGSKNNIGAETERQLWDAAARLGEFTMRSLMEDTGLSRYTVPKAITIWERQGKLQTLRRENRAFVYRLILDEAAKGQQVEFEGDEPQSIERNLWRAIRTLSRGYTAHDLAIHATTGQVQVTEAQAHKYCRLLVSAGLLAPLRKAVPGHRRATYRLSNDIGPRTPRPRKVQMLFDPNSKRLMHLAESELA